MNKFKVTVTRVDEYEIEVDENVWNEQALEQWSKVFWDCVDTEQVAKDLAVAYMRTDSRFIEGYGWVKELRKDGTEKGLLLPEGKEYAAGLTIKPLSFDEDYQTEIEKA